MAEEYQIPGVPYGDAFIVQTPYTDRMAAQLQQQAAERRAFNEKSILETDNLMNKELANVRSADMGQVLDAYNRYKNISQQFLFDKRIQNNPKEYASVQAEKNAAAGQTLALINRSTSLNNFQKELTVERKGRPGYFSDNFGNMISAFNQTPMNQLSSHELGDLTNPDTYRYSGSQTDFGKIDKAARGQLVKRGEKTEKIDELQSRVTPVMYYNTPLDYFKSYKGQLAQHIPGRDAEASWDAIPQAQKDAVDQAYLQIPPEKWQQMTGSNSPQIIAPENPTNKAEQYAAYQAKAYAVNAAPSYGTPQNITDQGSKIRLQQQLASGRDYQKHLYRLSEMNARYANMSALAKYKVGLTNPESGVPNVESIGSGLENPGSVNSSNKTNVQTVQDILSSWNSQGNTANTQTKLTALPTFTTPELSNVKGFDAMSESALSSIKNALNSIPEKGRAINWNDFSKKFHSNIPLDQKAQLLSDVYNEINRHNNVPVTFTADDIRKSVPLLYERNDIFKEGSQKTYKVVKTGTPEFNDVVNEKRNALLSSKKPVIQGGKEVPSQVKSVEVSGQNKNINAGKGVLNDL